MRHRRNPLVFTALAAVFLLACLCMAAVAATPAPNAAAALPASTGWGEVRTVEQMLSVHLKPDAASPLLRTIRPGERVRVDFPQPGGWVALFDLSETQRDVNRAIGYAESKQLGPVDSAKSAAAKPAPVKPTAPPVQAAPQQSAQALSQKPVSSTKPAGKPTPETEVKSAVKDKPAPSAGNAPSVGKDDPVRITSDKMVYSQAENAVVFQGNVHGTQADMAIWANKVTAYFSAKDKKPQGKNAPEKAPGDFGDKIERIVAEGDVRLVAGKNEGACAQLTYYVADGLLRMEGNPILREGQNTVRGDVIKYYMRESRSEVLSGSQRRVEAIFFSPKGGVK
ncbi:LptA/OstA family protein [Humidesulfovibrio sp.]